MKCPFCTHTDDKVVDSRSAEDERIIRRRRECLGCGKRFTTYERVDELLPLIIKKDARREPYDRAKVVAGIKRACEKRPVSVETIEKVADRIETELQDLGQREVPASEVGERVMRELHGLDPVAYVRFASVYRSFKDISEFMDELQGLLKKNK